MPSIIRPEPQVAAIDSAETYRPAVWPVGLVVGGRWRISGFLGAGGMGSVFAAQHRNGKRVALKVLHRHLLTQPRLKRRFLREGYLANRVDHPNVVSVLDDGHTDDGDVFLVMELLEGQTLDRRRKEVPLSVDDILDIADQVLDVLAAAHTKGIIHRDIKPANLFLATDDTVKVLDFGIASLKDSAFVPHDDPVGGLEFSGGFGTPSFMAPEQARGTRAPIDGRADVWSLGAVLFTLLTGRLVHETETVTDALVAAAMTRPLLVQSLRPDIPRCFAEIVNRALAFELSQRWSDARTMQLALREARRELTLCEPAAWDLVEKAPAAISDQATALTQRTIAQPTFRARSAWSWRAVPLAISVCAGIVGIGSLARPRGTASAQSSNDVASTTEGASSIQTDASPWSTPATRTVAPPTASAEAQAPSAPRAREANASFEPERRVELDRRASSANAAASSRKINRPTAPPSANAGSAPVAAPEPSGGELWGADESWLDRRK